MHPQPIPPDTQPPVIPMTATSLMVRLALIGTATYCWWTYNVVHGNAVAIEHLHLFVGMSELGRTRLIPMAGSLTQLYWDESLDLGVLRHPAVGVFCVVVGLFDTLGPAYGFLLTTGRDFTLPNLVLALGWGFFFSVVVQEVAWRLTKDVLAWLRHQVVSAFTPTRRTIHASKELHLEEPFQSRRRVPTTDPSPASRARHRLARRTASAAARPEERG